MASRLSQLTRLTGPALAPVSRFCAHSTLFSANRQVVQRLTTTSAIKRCELPPTPTASPFRNCGGRQYLSSGKQKASSERDPEIAILIAIALGVCTWIFNTPDTPAGTKLTTRFEASDHRARSHIASVRIYDGNGGTDVTLDEFVAAMMHLALP